MKKILLLDDDPLIHKLVSKIVSSLFYQFFSAFNVEEAKSLLNNEVIDFLICDLFLEGELGDKLSNDFIGTEIIPNNIPYCRLTSAPRLVPEDCKGIAVLDKREFYLDEIKLYTLLTNLK